MNSSHLLVILGRISWIISLGLSLFFAFLICDLSSSTYQTGAENFFEWGWIWALIFTFGIKNILLSKSFLEKGIGDQPISRVIPDDIIPVNHYSYPSEISGEEKIVTTPAIEYPSVGENLSPESTQPTFEEQIKYYKEPDPIEPPKPNWIVVFFSDRPLAKIGGIILFLAAFFFLSLIWSSIGAIGQVIIGLIFGFSLYAIGVWMDKKGHITESRTLLGVGIAVNTLTILSGRWIIGDASGSIFSDSVTLIFLVLNTLFAVVTGLVYSSRTFLVFSFVFAYLIPFLVRSETDSAILMMLYVLTISLGGYLLVWLFIQRSEREDDMKWLFRTIIIGNLILLSLTGFGIDSLAEYIVNSVITLVVVSIGIFLTSKTESKNESLPSLLISSYIILGCSILGIGDGEKGVIFATFLAIVPLMVYTGVFMIQSTLIIFSWILLLPLIFGLLLLGVFGIPSLIFILVPIVFLYGISAIFLMTIMTGFFQYVFYFATSIFLLICAISLDIQPLDITDSERLIISISSLLFFLLSLWSGLKNKLTHLSLVSLFSSSIILVFTLVPEWSGSWLFYFIFLAITYTYPFFFGKSLLEKAATFIGYQVLANLFMIGELFYLGNDLWFTGNSSSLITLGIIVFSLSVGSLVYTLSLLRISGSTNVFSLTSEEKNGAMALLGIPLSLFTLAIAITFSNSPLIVSMAWVLESCVLAFYSGRMKHRLVLIGSIFLLAIGLLRLIPFFDSIQTGDYLALVPIFITSLGLYFSLLFIEKRSDEPLGSIFDVIHIFGIAMVGYAIMEIVPHTRTGWSLVGLNIFLMLSTWFYTKVTSKIIMVWMAFLSVIVFLYHLGRVDTLDMSFIPVGIQLSALALGTYSVWYMKEKHEFGKYVFIFAFILVILITSLYVNEITDNVFVVTIYLTLIATAYLLLGINGDSTKYRTIGLYIGTVVLVKILFYDIWAGVDNLIIRVVALMISGGVMIALSQLYGRRVNRGWKEEFSYSNLFSKSISADQGTDDSHSGDSFSSNGPEDDMPFDEMLTSDLKKYDISQIASVELQDSMGNTILISRRAGILRVANSIVVHFKKYDFLPKELSKVLENVLPHIRSSLPKTELESMLGKIEYWIVSGGKIILHKKKNPS